MDTRTLTSGKFTTAFTRENARQRAIDEGIEVRQVERSSLWIASSGTKADKAYVLNIVDGQVKNCQCRAGEFGGYCKHRAAWEMTRESQGTV